MKHVSERMGYIAAAVLMASIILLVAITSIGIAWKIFQYFFI